MILTEPQKKQIRAHLRQMTPEEREKLKLDTIALIDRCRGRRASKQEPLPPREEISRALKATVIRGVKAMTAQERADVRKEVNRLLRKTEPHRFTPSYLQLVK